ncbi:hypothetical protein BC940DRAFT_333269 [Gongronella butleri]|nr:hypothetical protein BC940DRAFT_333269 [Gongronella butleri]
MGGRQHPQICRPSNRPIRCFKVRFAARDPNILLWLQRRWARATGETPTYNRGTRECTLHLNIAPGTESRQLFMRGFQFIRGNWPDGEPLPYRIAMLERLLTQELVPIGAFSPKYIRIPSRCRQLSSLQFAPIGIQVFVTLHMPFD